MEIVRTGFHSKYNTNLTGFNRPIIVYVIAVDCLHLALDGGVRHVHKAIQRDDGRDKINYLLPFILS